MDDEPGSGADDIGVGGMVGVAGRANSWILSITFYIFSSGRSSLSYAVSLLV